MIGLDSKVQACMNTPPTLGGENGQVTAESTGESTRETCYEASCAKAGGKSCTS
ncbi:hypothetical protein [Rhizobium gallicum]|uniref:hypothetical protein n=1 Tax=Rhizobium gallicum TaxID=56730 RepID=UPI0012EB9C50|nr:hypothetical protein [Rhizobium gallicum]